MTVAAALGGHPVAGPRDDLAAARDDGRGVADGDAATTRSGSRRRRPTRWGSSPSAFNTMAADLAGADQQRRAARGDRLPRAAHPARRPAGAAREPRRRGRASRRRRAADRPGPGRAARRASSATCSTSAGSTPAARPSTSPRRRRELLVEARGGGRGLPARHRPRRRRTRPTCTSPRTGPSRSRSSPTCSTTPTGTARPAGACTVGAGADGDRLVAQGRRRGPRHPGRARPARLRPLRLRRRRGAVARASGWPSPAGSASCTAGPSPP